ncbi:cyclic nucleotide-binding domain protein (macronuclear) [Tetrahymena thermophila SB210]|uniref:Cyclic nucleotide-binding domain protein n=1 Tax=Tetrahymena thermophila (strain SB210) TaxID=312017 RepID=I7MH23_TETTS|nr:cyclic nucleotide-binding domain protein [Tetrahymena thermophila SB210]EAS02433.2 cyclic nucleotide-binding domain protein [Tetrahymena thermophila SB210]|eukprot:XP_001022678.2 cyclic nucleotide-binding domain protein [Tetrahymena thermophila SB210]
MPFTFEQIDLFQKIIKQSEHNENSVSTFAKQDLYLTTHYILEKKPYLRTTSELKYLIMMTKNQKFIKEIILQQDGQVAVYEICRKYQVKISKKGEYIFMQGQPKKCFIMILSGEAQIVQDSDNQSQFNQEQLNSLGQGSIVELPLRGANFKRNSKQGELQIKIDIENEEVHQNSLICQTECSYLILQKDNLDKIMSDFKQRIKFFEELSQMNLFKGWNKNQIRMIQDCFFEKQYAINNVVYKDGDESNYLYLVKEGEFVLQKVIEAIDEVKEAEKKEIQSMIHNIQQQNKKRYLLKNQESHLTAIEKQLKSIDPQDSPTEITFEDQIRKKRIKKGELKKIKIISQGETFGAEEFLSLLIDPEQRQSFQSSLVQKRQLTASCSSVTGVLYVIHVKDIFQKIAKSEELLPMLLKSLKQKILSSENQVNLIKKQKHRTPQELNVAKNLYLNTEEEEEIKDSDKNVLRNYDFNEFKIEKRIVYPDESNKINLSDNKQKSNTHPKSEKILLLSSVITQKKKKKNHYKVSEIVARIEKQEMGKQESISKDQIEKQDENNKKYQRASKKKSNTVVILSTQSSSEAQLIQKAEKKSLTNNDSLKNLKQIISESQISSQLPKSKYSLANLESNSSLAHLQVEEEKSKHSLDQLIAFGKKINQKAQQSSNEDLSPVKSPSNSQQRIFSVDKFPIRQFRKSNNQIEYKFELQQQNNSLQKVLQSPQEQIIQQNINSSIHSHHNHENIFQNQNPIKKKFAQLQKMDSFNSNNTNSPKSFYAQPILKADSQEYIQGLDSPKTVTSLLSPKSLSQFDQNDRSKFFQYSKPKTQNKINNENNTIKTSQTLLSFKPQNKTISQSVVLQSKTQNKFKFENQLSYSNFDENRVSNSNTKEVFSQTHNIMSSQKGDQQKIQNQQQISFQNHRKLSSPNLISRSSFLPLKYYASQISNSQTKLNFIPKILKHHTKEALFNEFKQFTLSVKNQKTKTES